MEKWLYPREELPNFEDFNNPEDGVHLLFKALSEIAREGKFPLWKKGDGESYFNDLLNNAGAEPFQI
ncbi:MAG: hypothetical protein GY859_10295 [Desulfobacterales bacterium]|nr:hypothetical protein [Desulfobacterales bacterium]